MHRRELLRRLVALPFVGALAKALHVERADVSGPITGRHYDQIIVDDPTEGVGQFRGRSMVLNSKAPVRAYPPRGTYRFKVVPGETIEKGDPLVVDSNSGMLVKATGDDDERIFGVAEDPADWEWFTGPIGPDETVVSI